TVLFTTAGMHPLISYLSGQKHPLGKRLCNVQKCIRTGDIDEVGDTYHHTFFEMLGNWSLGNYFKKQAIEFSFEFLTKILKIPKEKISATCFKGNKNSPKDIESSEIWNYLKESKNFIYVIVAVFFVFVLIGFFIPAPDSLVKQILEFIKDLLEKTQAMSQGELIKFIFLNNLQSSFYGMIFGVLLGIFPMIAA
ncbi:unnamed protein product, partial [marine sediment metagenome]